MTSRTDIVLAQTSAPCFGVSCEQIVFEWAPRAGSCFAEAQGARGAWFAWAAFFADRFESAWWPSLFCLPSSVSPVVSRPRPSRPRRRPPSATPPFLSPSSFSRSFLGPI